MTGNLRKRGENLYESGHVSEVEYYNISDCLKFCYVRGKVVPQTRIGENPYTVWVCLNTTNGDKGGNFIYPMMLRD